MAPSAALTSDHVNYLVFRYLQEAGHEKSAIAFSNDWHRTAEFHDPENLPFAPAVRRNELVSIIQSGLQHDELESRVSKNERRFRLTRVTSRDGSQHVFENGGSTSASGAGSRPGSSAKRKSRLSAMRAQGDFPTPAAKRQRRSEERQTNGDLMDVDAVSVADGEADEHDEAPSPTVASDPDMMEVPARYDSMDVAVQTESKTGPKTSTMYWKIEKPGATIYHSIFNPTSDAENSNTLMTVGDSLCRFYQIPENLDHAQQVLSVDEPTLPLNAVVTASAWHPNGHVVVIAADTIREPSDDAQASQQALFSHDCTTGEHIQYSGAPSLDPQGIVLALRYNHSGSRLLVLWTNIKRGLIQIYNTENADTDKTLPIAWSTYEQQVLDAAWLTDTEYVVVGDNGLAQTAHIEAEATNGSTFDLANGETKSLHISHTAIDLAEGEREHSFDKVRVGFTSLRPGAVVLASIQHKALVLAQRSHKDGADHHKYAVSTQLSDRMTAIAFQPLAETVQTSEPSVIAVASEDGSCVLYLITPPGDSNEDKTEQRFSQVVTMYLNGGPALALAWSPDGAFLAVAGLDLVQIWELNSLVTKESGRAERRTETVPKALVTWRPDADAVRARNGEHGDAATISEPSLSWSADGQSLGFAVDQEVAIISFRPPLGKKDEIEGVNGHASP